MREMGNKIEKVPHEEQLKWIADNSHTKSSSDNAIISGTFYECQPECHGSSNTGNKGRGKRTTRGGSRKQRK